MLDGITSRLAARRFGIAGVALLILCVGLVGWRMFSGFADPTDIACEENLSLKVEPDLAAKHKAGILTVIGVYPAQTSINRHICVAVGGVVTEAAEKRLADEVARAQKLRDDASASYASAAGSARDGAWEKLQKAEMALATALAAAAGQPQPVDLSVFLNGKTAPDLKVKAYATSAPQILRFRLAVPTNAGDSGASFWRELLSASSAGGEAAKIGQKAVAVGLSRSAATMPEATSDGLLTVVIYDAVILWVGIAAFLSLVVGFCGLARHTTLLRDNARTEPASSITSAALLASQAAEVAARAQEKAAAAAAAKASAEADAAKAAADSAGPAKKAAETAKAEQTAVALTIAKAAHVAATTAMTAAAAQLKDSEAKAVSGAKSGDVEQPLGPYSLARTQIAFWLILTLAGFVFIWLSMGLYLGLITGGILVLLGINGATGLASVSMNDAADKVSTSESFFADILNDGDGPKLHRIQAVAWTVVLGVIFAWNVVWNFTFVNFDTNLLLLIGIAQGMYLGFKWKEAPAK